MAEDHPLAVRGGWKKPFTGRADVVLAVGFKFWSGEHFDAAPTWNEAAAYIQLDAAPSRIGWHVPAAVALVGDPKLVLQQLVDTVRGLGIDFSGRRDASWLQEVTEARASGGPTTRCRFIRTVWDVTSAGPSIGMRPS